MSSEEIQGHGASDWPGPVVPGPSPDPTPPEPDAIRRQPPRPARLVEEFVAMVTRASPLGDPLSRRLKPEHVTRILRLGEQEARQDYELKRQAQINQVLVVKLVAGLAAFAMVALLLLCWLFFAYGKADQVSTIITMLIVGGGGVGIGTGIRRLTPGSNRDTPEPPQA